MAEHRHCDACGKVCYRGRGDAKRAHGAASYRIRTYYCEAGRAWHVTNGEKRHRQSSWGEHRSNAWRR